MVDESNENLLTESAYEVSEHLTIPVYADVQRYPCSNCGRAFNVESLRKHQPICQNTSQKKQRKVFDMGKQRATDSDVPYAATRETTKFYNEGIKPKDSIKKKSTKNHWREDHQELVRTIRQARRGSQIKTSIVSQEKSTNNDFIQCEYCHRIFNPYSAERHIPFCQTQFKRKQMLVKTSHSIQRPQNTPKFGRFQPSSHQINSAPSLFVPKTTPSKSSRRPAPSSQSNTVSPRKPSNYLLGMMKNNGKIGQTKVSTNAAKHCHQCGQAFPVQWAKFCCECGEKRHGID